MFKLIWELYPGPSLASCGHRAGPRKKQKRSWRNGRSCQRKLCNSRHLTPHYCACDVRMVDSLRCCIPLLIHMPAQPGNADAAVNRATALRGLPAGKMRESRRCCESWPVCLAQNVTRMLRPWSARLPSRARGMREPETGTRSDATQSLSWWAQSRRVTVTVTVTVTVRPSTLLTAAAVTSRGCGHGGCSAITPSAERRDAVTVLVGAVTSCHGQRGQ